MPVNSTAMPTSLSSGRSCYSRTSRSYDTTRPPRSRLLIDGKAGGVVGGHSSWRGPATGFQQRLGVATRGGGVVQSVGIVAEVCGGAANGAAGG